MKKTGQAKLVEEINALRARLAEQQQESQQSQTKIETVLRERLKELDCLYTITKLSEIHFYSAERFLQAVADRISASFLFSDCARTRIVWEKKSYESSGFQMSPWKIEVQISVDGKPGGLIQVCYPVLPPNVEGDPFLKEEYALINDIAERVGSVLGRMRAEEALREAHAALQREHQALQETNIALRSVLSRLEDEKREIRNSIASNVQKILMPIIFELEMNVGGPQRSYVALLRQTLMEIASPFLSQLVTNHLSLSPVEISIATMIRNGLSTKEIAHLRSISQATVRRHRENMRKKLSLQNRKINLVTYLQSSADGVGESAL